MRSPASRIPRFTAVACMVVLLGACSTGASPAASEMASPPAPSPVASPAAEPTPSSAASIVAPPIADGTYRTQPLQVSAMVAHIKADATLTAAQKAADLQIFSGHQTEVIGLTFQAGEFTESAAFDGGPFEVGARATYAFSDPTTLVIEEACCGLSTFEITPQPNGFSLHYKVGAPNAGEDVVGQTVYESGPFTRVP